MHLLFAPSFVTCKHKMHFLQSSLSYTSIIPWNEWLYTFSIKLEITIPNLVLNHWHKASREKYSLCQYFLLRNNLIKAISSEQSTQAPLKEGRYTLYRRNCIKKNNETRHINKTRFSVGRRGEEGDKSYCSLKKTGAQICLISLS